MSALFPNRHVPVTCPNNIKSTRKALRAMSPEERRAFLAMCGYQAAARQIVAEAKMHWSKKSK